MNKYDLIKALGDIDDKYLIEKYEPHKNERKATSNNKYRKNFNIRNFDRKEVNIMDRRVWGIAAIAVLVISGICVGTLNIKQNNFIGDSNELVQITNSITELNSVQEMKKYLGFDVPVLKKDVEAYIVIGDGNYAEHARIMYKDGTRFEMEKGEKDVSGIYGGTLNETKEIENVEVQIYIYENIKYANWQKDGFSYSYCIDGTKLNFDEISALINY